MSRGLIAKYLRKPSVCIAVLATVLFAVFLFHGTCYAEGESHGCAICGHPPEPPWHYPGCPYYDGGLDDEIKDDDRQPPPPRPIYPDRTKQNLEQQKKNRAYELNDQGLAYLDQKNYQKAVECFKKALALSYHENIEKNLKLAQEYLADERHTQSLAESEKKVNQMLDSLAEDLGADRPTTASADDLDFKEAGESRYSKGTKSSTTADSTSQIGVAGAVSGGVYIVQADGTKKRVTAGMPIDFKSKVLTDSSGRLQIMLLDETVFTVGPNSEMVLDEFVYDPSTQSSKVRAKVLKGIFRYITGKIPRKKPSDVQINIPACAVGIRGTDVVISQDDKEDSWTLYLREGELEVTPVSTDKAWHVKGAQVVVIDSSGIGTIAPLSEREWKAVLKTLGQR
jgi:hypothetical protein